MTADADHIFLTGATGFIGSGLLQKLLLAEPAAAITLLVRSRRGEKPRDRIGKLLAELSAGAEAAVADNRVSILEGDISIDRFGLEDRHYSGLAARTTRIIHCAAAVRFDLPLEEARAINVAGSESVIALADQCRNLSRLDYVGTAYVAGRRTGLIREDELDLGQEHNNTYERTKMESEIGMRRAMQRLPIAVYRPSIVICDSRTGRISAYSAFCRMLRAYHAGQLKALPGHASTLLDIVPIDYVADAICAIARRPDSLGRSFHLTAGMDNLTSLGEIQDLAGTHFRRARFAIVPPEAFEASARAMEAGLSEDERDFLDEIRIYKPYLSGNLRFDDSNARALLPRSHAVPKLSDYFGRMAAFVMALPHPT